MATCCVQRRRRYVHFVFIASKEYCVLTTSLPPPQPCALYLWEVSGCTGAPVLSWRFGFRRFRWFGAAWRAASCGCARDRVHFKYIVSAYESRISRLDETVAVFASHQHHHSRIHVTRPDPPTPPPLHALLPLVLRPSSLGRRAADRAPCRAPPTGQVPRQCRAGGGEEGANQA